MDPNVLDAAGWAEVGNLVAKLVFFVVLMVLGAFSLLLGRAVLPSLLLTHEVVAQFAVHRRVLIVLSLISFALAIVEFARAVVQILAILQPFYPRYGF